MDDQLLRTTLQVARLGSFAAVAREAGADPSSVSRQVAALEQALGFCVFERTTRRLSLTEAGRLYLDRAVVALEAMDEAADFARDAISDPSGVLRVTTSIAFAERWLIPRLAGFRAAYPRIYLELILSDTMVDLAQDGLDLAIRLGPQPEGGAMICAKLFDTPYKVVAAPEYLARVGHPETPEDLRDHDGVLFRLPPFRAKWQFRHRPTGEQAQALPRPALTISNALALRRAVLSGMGVALIADWTIADDLRSGALIDVFPAYEVRAAQANSAAWVVYLSRDYMPARLRFFIDHLKLEAPNSQA